MKTILTFGIALVATLLFVSASVIHKQNAAISVPCACDDAIRYDRTETAGGGTRITDQAACALIRNYDRKVGANRGGFISKKVLDNIFCNKTFNGINFYFAMDTTMEKNTIRLVIEGTHLSNTATGTLGASTDRYVNQTYCPPSCGAFSTGDCK